MCRRRSRLLTPSSFLAQFISHRDFHPSATLFRVYFENTHSLSRISSDGRTEIGMRVALDDTDGPAMTELLIFRNTHSSPTTPSLTIHVARITLTPPRRFHTPKTASTSSHTHTIHRKTCSEIEDQSQRE
ncbi:hypothetical protein EDB19DRAFT_1805645 [Suillus lakei]|nr:hypothetical protein EDB19DRAFT_1805645 [Suillus lakei]